MQRASKKMGKGQVAEARTSRRAQGWRLGMTMGMMGMQDGRLAC